VRAARIHDEVSEPKAHGALLAKDPFEGWFHCLKVEKRLIDIKDDQGMSDHVIRLRLARPMPYGRIVAWKRERRCRISHLYLFGRAVALVTAARIISTTNCGAVTSGAWSISSDRVCALIRRAKNSCVAGLIIRSS
jgi:hypothetical protein